MGKSQPCVVVTGAWERCCQFLNEWALTFAVCICQRHCCQVQFFPFISWATTGEQLCCITSWAHSAFPLLPFHPFRLWPAGTFCLGTWGQEIGFFLLRSYFCIPEHPQVKPGTYILANEKEAVPLQPPFWPFPLYCFTVNVQYFTWM